ncbi:flgL [Wigglesworthia glossinidia endosymbiont of Glossina brevipalpis]|uniref:FlgL protein n=1 Tax=Wigglesworthia glossinidia brevipalpis TaxID=36870 RepID=Q8D3F4_WIGBR|nr:flgL [Wigglesworthia glossinidia endosymbiont of Glossina brevipalpis]
MNLSTRLLYNNYISNILYNTSQFHELTSRLSSGKRIMKSSDNPQCLSSSIINQKNISKLNRFNQTRNYIKNFLSKECNVLQNISNSLSIIGVKVISIQQSLGDPSVLISELKSLRNELIMLANSTDLNNNYIFSGNHVDKTPFSEKENNEYQGSIYKNKLLISENWSIELGHIGKEIFIKNEEENLFQRLDSLIKELTQYSLKKRENKNELELNSSFPNKLINETKILIKKTEDKVFLAQSESGNCLNKLERLEESEKNSVEHINEITQNMLGQNHSELIKIASEIQMYKTVVSSSIEVFQIMKNMSLFNYLR